MGTTQEHSTDMAELEAALGVNVVRFVPPHREEPELAVGEWAASLELIDQAAAFVKDSELRASEAEARAKDVAFRAIEELKTAQLRVEEAEARTWEIEQRATEEIRLARGQIADAEAWAKAAEDRAQDAESRAEAAEARAQYAEEWLQRLTDAVKQKLSLGQSEGAESPLQALRRMSAG